MHDFTQRKFLSFPLERQHKKCAEIVRSLYELGLQGGSIYEGLAAYNQLLNWMCLPPLNELSAKTLANCYHCHLKQAGVFKKEHDFLPTVKTNDRPQGEEVWPIAIYLDQLRSAHNVGSIIRTVEAFALGSLYFSSQTPFTNNKQVQDVSMGTHQWVTCHQNIELEALRRPIIALETSDEAISLNEFIFPATFTLVVGNEEYGCSDTTLALANYLIEIPLRGRKNSLNVANAFAIAASEINRQKRFKQQQVHHDKKNNAK